MMSAEELFPKVFAALSVSARKVVKSLDVSYGISRNNVQQKCNLSAKACASTLKTLVDAEVIVVDTHYNFSLNMSRLLFLNTKSNADIKKSLKHRKQARVPFSPFREPGTVVAVTAKSPSTTTTFVGKVVGDNSTHRRNSGTTTVFARELTCLFGEPSESDDVFTVTFPVDAQMDSFTGMLFSFDVHDVDGSATQEPSAPNMTVAVEMYDHTKVYMNSYKTVYE